MCSFLYLLSLKRTVYILVKDGLCEVKRAKSTILLAWKLGRAFLHSEMEGCSNLQPGMEK